MRSHLMAVYNTKEVARIVHLYNEINAPEHLSEWMLPESAEDLSNLLDEYMRLPVDMKRQLGIPVREYRSHIRQSYRPFDKNDDLDLPF